MTPQTVLGQEKGKATDSLSVFTFSPIHLASQWEKWAFFVDSHFVVIVVLASVTQS